MKAGDEGSTVIESLRFLAHVSRNRRLADLAAKSREAPQGKILLLDRSSLEDLAELVADLLEFMKEKEAPDGP